MTDIDVKEKFDKIRDDKKFGRQLYAAESPEAIVTLFSSKGILVDIEDAQRGYEILHEPDDIFDELLREIGDEVSK